MLTTSPKSVQVILPKFVQFILPLTKGYGHELSTVFDRVKFVLKNREWTVELLTKHQVNLKMMESISKELLDEQDISFFIQTEKVGIFKNKEKKRTYFRITEKGLNIIKNAKPPQNPLLNI